MKELLKDLGITKTQLKRVINGKKYYAKIIKEHITDSEIEFAVVSDTHLCSNHECLDELHTFYAICKKMGIKSVLHAGDLVAGTGVYRGQENELKVFGFKRQADYVVSHYPKVEGIITYFICGNHDLVYWKNAGVDIGETIASKRPDMMYLGQDKADLRVGKLRVKLLHPGGGTAYADSYHLQRTIASLESGNKPHILVMGHYHRSLYINDRNVNGILGGTFEKQSVFQLRKNINPRIGGWTCKVRMDKNGVVSFTPSWIPFF